MELSQEPHGKNSSHFCKDFLYRPKPFEPLLKIVIFSLLQKLSNDRTVYSSQKSSIIPYWTLLKIMLPSGNTLQLDFMQKIIYHSMYICFHIKFLSLYMSFFYYRKYALNDFIFTKQALHDFLHKFSCIIITKLIKCTLSPFTKHTCMQCLQSVP